MATSKKRAVKPAKKKRETPTVPSEIVVEQTEGATEPQEELQRDLLDDFLFHAANYIYVRRKLFISLGVAVAVIIASVYGAFRYIGYQDNLRNEELFAIEKIINDSAVTDSRRFERALPLLNRFLADYQDTDQAVLALLQRGGLFYSQNKFAQAEADFQAVRTAETGESELYLLASIYLSNVLRDQKKSNQAIEILQSAQTGKMADVILMELAEIYRQTDQVKKAKETLEILQKDYPKSPYASRAKQLLNLL